MAESGTGPDIETLRRSLIYDPDTGVFTRRVRCGRVMAGAVAGCVRPDGYVKICVGGKSYLAHRLAWQYVHGHAPTDEVDHINGDKADNRIANLRAVDRQTNQENWRKTRKNKVTSDFLGVSWRKDRGCFVAQIGFKRKCYNLGHFDTEEAAHECYLEAKRKLHAGCTI